jgi:hypothetical protein
MSLPISALTAIAKTSIGATHYLPLADGTAANYKLLIQDLFPAMNTLGTSSESLFVSVTNKNTLNFKGIRSLSNILSVGTNANNIQLNIIPAQIDLSLCDNSTSAFLTGPISLSAGVGGTLPVANGGTGLTSLLANSLFIGNGTSALTALGVATNGQIPIGRTGLSPVLATLTAGTNVSVTNGAGSITIAASLTTLTQNLYGAGYNIYGLGWLSGDGEDEGISIDSAGRVFIGSSIPTPFFNSDLNINNGITFNGSITQQLQMTSSPSPGNMGISAASASVANANGGFISLTGGSASGTGTAGYAGIFGAGATGSGAGGAALVYGGTSNTGQGGNVQLIAGNSTSGLGGSTSIIAGNSSTNAGGNVNLGAGNAGGATTGGSITLTGGTSVTGTGGNINLIPKGSSTTPGTVIQIASTATAAFTDFLGTQTGASANSLSSSTASASAKTGAIKVKINGVDAWIRVYATAE